MPLPIEQRGDEFVWGHTGNGKFTVKSASELQTANVASHTCTKLLNCMWKLNLAPKITFFNWLLICERLKTRQRLNSFTNSIPDTCVFCNNHEEFMDHLFMQCSFSQSVWLLSALPSSPIHWDRSFV